MAGQPQEELETWYIERDPWGYGVHPCDARRKLCILETLKQFKPSYRRALDIGCGEGWLTKDLPAAEIHGHELSNTAAARLPPNIQRVQTSPHMYDLVLATGVLYAHYDWETMVEMIQRHASEYVLTCNIKEWEIAEAIKKIPGKQLLETEFPYREYTQKLRVFDASAMAR